MNVCPECGATVRPDAPWCTLCYHDLRRRAVDVAQPEPVAAAGAAGGQLDGVPNPRSARHAAQVDQATAPARWPCTRCGTENDLADASCGACGAGFLAEMREQNGVSLRLPIVGDLGRLHKGTSYALAVGFAIVVALLVALVSLVL